MAHLRRQPLVRINQIIEAAEPLLRRVREMRRVDQKLLAEDQRAEQLAHLQDRVLAVLPRSTHPDRERRPLARPSAAATPAEPPTATCPAPPRAPSRTRQPQASGDAECPSAPPPTEASANRQASPSGAWASARRRLPLATPHQHRPAQLLPQLPARRQIASSMLRARIAGLHRPVDMAEMPRHTRLDRLAAPSALDQSPHHPPRHRPP